MSGYTVLTQNDQVVGAANPLQIGGSMNITGITKPTTFVTGQKQVATPGTRVALVASTTPLVRGVLRITALPGNTGIVYVGGAAVTAANGEALSADKTLIMEIDDLNRIWLDTSVAGSAVSFLGY